MDFTNKNVLITGAGGFVGTRAAKYFEDRGAHVVALIKDEGRKLRLRDVVKNLTIVRGDIRDYDCLRYCLGKYEIDYVLHLASQPIVRICHTDPYDAYTTNVGGVLNLLENVRAAEKKPEKIVVMVSDKCYGPARVPYKEDTPYVVYDSYTTSKACQDMITLSYARTYDVPACVVRAGNLYGPGDLNTSRLIPRNILRLFDGQRPVLYSGVANFKREFIYIDNIISAYETIFEHGKPGEAYNVGGTQPQTILNVLQMIRDKINPSIEIDIIEKEFDEIEEQYLDATKIGELGWKSEIGISEGLDRSIAWYKKYRDERGW